LSSQAQQLQQTVSFFKVGDEQSSVPARVLTEGKTAKTGNGKVEEAAQNLEYTRAA
jgi:hypothetical protein